MEKPKADSHLGEILGGGFALVVALYFLLPMVILVPLWWGSHLGFVSRAVEFRFEGPIIFLAQRVPAYQMLFDAEYGYCKRKGLLPADPR